MGVLFNFCFINFLPRHAVETAKPKNHFGPLVPQIRVKSMSRRFKPDDVDYWEGALQCLFYKLCLKMIEHSSKSTWGPVLPDPDFWVQRYVMPPTKSWMLYNFCFASFLPNCTVEAAEPP